MQRYSTLINCLNKILSTNDKEYALGRYVLLFNVFEDNRRGYNKLFFTIFFISYVIPLLYYVTCRNFPAITTNFINDYLYSIVVVLLSPLHAILIKNLWNTLNRMVANIKERQSEFRLDNDSISRIVKSGSFSYMKFVFYIIIPIVSFVLSIIVLKFRDTPYWWAKNDYEQFGRFIFLVSVSFLFYQLLCHNILGIIAIRTLRIVKMVNPHIDFWQEHNGYGFPDFPKIFIRIIASSILHLTSIYALYYFQYFAMNIKIPYFIFSIIFIIFGPLFWYYPLYLTHRIIEQEKAIKLDYLSSKINKSTFVTKLLQLRYEYEYESIKSKKTWPITIPVNLLSGLYAILGIAGILYGIKS